MDAIERTQQLERTFLPITDLEPNESNPNEMSDAEFNMLSDNIEKMGITDPILVRRKKPEEITPEKPASYRIIGGHHRCEVAKLVGFEKVPCTVVTAEDFDQDQEDFQVVRMNMIRGHMSPEKFFQLYSKMSQKYADDVMRESFGFVSEEEFQKLIKQVKKTLPKEMQAEFQKAAKEMKTIDDLSKVLNHLFTSFGSTLPYGYMLLDFGGKDSVWLRMGSDTRKAVLELGKLCAMNHRTMDDMIGGLIRKAAKGELSSVLLQLIADSTPVVIPEGVKLPTAEVLAGTATAIS